MSEQERDADDERRWDAVEEASELLMEERVHEALAELRTVLQNDPQNYYGYYYLGVGMYEVGEFEGARDALRLAVKLAPKHLGARVALANVLRELDDARAAVREGMVALDLSPEDGDALHAVGMAHAALGERALAKRFLRAFLLKKPEFEVATEVQGILDALENADAEQRPN